MTLIWQVVAPDDVVQPPEPGVIFAVTEGAAPFTATVSDCAFGDT